MKTQASLAFLPALLLGACSSPSYHGGDGSRPELLEPQNRVVILAGQRMMDDDFEPAEDQLAFGLEVNLEPIDMPVGVEFGVGFSDDSSSKGGVDADVTTYDLTLGVRKTFRIADGRLRPYVALGGSFIDVDASATGGFDDSDSGFGVYARAGLWFMITDSVGVGADYRKLMAADVKLGGSNVDADYDQISLGFSFGF